MVRIGRDGLHRGLCRGADDGRSPPAVHGERETANHPGSRAEHRVLRLARREADHRLGRPRHGVHRPVPRRRLHARRLPALHQGHLVLQGRRLLLGEAQREEIRPYDVRLCHPLPLSGERTPCAGEPVRRAGPRDGRPRQGHGGTHRGDLLRRRDRPLHHPPAPCRGVLLRQDPPRMGGKRGRELPETLHFRHRRRTGGRTGRIRGLPLPEREENHDRLPAETRLQLRFATEGRDPRRGYPDYLQQRRLSGG